MKTNMESKKLLVFVTAVFALAIVLVSGVTAFAGITSIEVNDVEVLFGTNIAAFSGETLPVRVVFDALSDAQDVRVKAWIAGERDLAISSERFDVLSGSTYSRLLNVRIPSGIDPSEDFTLMVSLENRADGVGDQESVSIAGQRESYSVSVLDVDVDTKVKAGDNLVIDIVLKNTGRQLAEDTFVRVTIPQLGISEKVYFGDLSALDQPNKDNPNAHEREDAGARRIQLSIPSNARSGVYVVEVEAFNSDTIETVTRKVAIVGASEDTIVVSPATSKTFAAGENAKYGLTLVNTGNTVRVFDFTVESTSGSLSIDAISPVVVVPAGTSKTVRFDVVASDNGEYNFAVNVNSNGELVEKVDFTANVKGTNIAGNATVLLTVILAIIFVVLLVVLIILLTRKPNTAEEFGESYY